MAGAEEDRLAVKWGSVLVLPHPAIQHVVGPRAVVSLNPKRGGFDKFARWIGGLHMSVCHLLVVALIVVSCKSFPSRGSRRRGLAWRWMPVPSAYEVEEGHENGGRRGTVRRQGCGAALKRESAEICRRGR